MANSTCIKCNGQFFEVHETNVAGTEFRLMFIQCSACGGVVGVQDFWNIGATLKDVEARVISVERKLGHAG